MDTSIRDALDAHAAADAARRAAERADNNPVSYDNIMLDIETMSTHTSRALVLSIGLVPFTLTTFGPLMGSPLLIIMDLTDQLAGGRVVDADTQNWWADQPAEARAHWADPSYDPPYAKIISTRDQLEYNIGAVLDCPSCGDLTRARIWSRGIVFDLGNIEGMIRETGGRPPWRYDVARDMRTVVRELDRVRLAPGRPHVAHDPVSDCIKQIWDMWEVAPAAWLHEVVLEAAPEDAGAAPEARPTPVPAAAPEGLVERLESLAARTPAPPPPLLDPARHTAHLKVG